MKAANEDKIKDPDKYRLRDFPLVARGVVHICFDQHMRGLPIPDLDKEIIEWWLPAFQVAEAELAEIQRRYPRLQDIYIDFPGQMQKMDWLEDFDLGDNSTNTLCMIHMGMNDSARDIMNLLEVDKARQFCIEQIFHQYFEGELRDMLSMKDPTPEQEAALAKWLEPDFQ